MLRELVHGVLRRRHAHAEVLVLDEDGVRDLRRARGEFRAPGREFVPGRCPGDAQVQLQALQLQLQRRPSPTIFILPNARLRHRQQALAVLLRLLGLHERVVLLHLAQRARTLLRLLDLLLQGDVAAAVDVAVVGDGGSAAAAAAAAAHRELMAECSEPPRNLAVDAAIAIYRESLLAGPPVAFLH